LTELRATYRLQLGPSLSFAGARSLIPYLRDLGISHLYLSPSLQARPGSTHGYDVVDPSRLSEDLGGSEEFRRLAQDARSSGLGVVLDVVPNHMAADDANRYWADETLRSRFFDLDPFSGRWRRFFDIDDLAGVRQEDPAVFEATHSLVLSLVREGLVDGLRVDHPDGLADPSRYLERLRSYGAERVWVEKILDPSEHLRDWPVCGTVGYEFLNDVCALCVDPAGEAPLTSLWTSISGDSRGFGEVAHEAKLEQLRGPFRPEVERLMRLDPPVGREAMEHALAALPVYRTYVSPDRRIVVDEDRAAVAASEMAPELARALLLERPAVPELVTRFQQTTPAVMAKGVEDTAFYRYARLIALNDVGGDPSRFAIDVDRFHQGCLERAERFPMNLLTRQTHDAKRSGDVRARIAVLASIPEEWKSHVMRWMEIGSGRAPDAVERYFLFQTLLGAWPISEERIVQYMEKALREAKRNTNWIEPDEDWERAVFDYCRSLLSDREFLDDFEPFAARVASLGDPSAWRQLVLKLTVPGIPDFYQGDEIAFRTLVDPDNRRPVDWQWRQAMLSRLMGGSQPDSETMKLWITLSLLNLRARRPEPFAGSYEPLDAGPSACAFVREGDVLVVVRVRDVDYEDGSLLGAPGGRWRDALRGDERSFGSSEPVSSVVDEHGLAVFERVA
jgi:(1->4)-alpha-D-glucan 1-alpha-D-glucosylmutase